MEKANQIQIGMLGVIILMLGYLIFAGGVGTANASDDEAIREAARQKLSVNNPQAKAQPAANKKAEPPKPTGPTTTMEFEESEFDFGTITEGESVKHTFKFKNTGKEPLVISNAKGSCGCTVPKWPRKPIAPGEEGEIEVQFNSKGKPGNQRKSVTITANTDPVTTRLNIKAQVERDPNAPKKPAANKAAMPKITPQNHDGHSH